MERNKQYQILPYFFKYQKDFITYNEGKRSSHWNEAFVGHDIMTPSSSLYNIMTLITIEMIEHATPSFKIDRNFVPNNFYFDNIENKDEFFRYKCQDDKPSKYDVFCS